MVEGGVEPFGEASCGCCWFGFGDHGIGVEEGGVVVAVVVGGRLFVRGWWCCGRVEEAPKVWSVDWRVASAAAEEGEDRCCEKGGEGWGWVSWC